HLNGALIAAELLAIAEMLVAEVAAVVDVELRIRILVEGAESVRNIAVVPGPSINAARRHARTRHRLAADEVGDVGLVHQQVGGNAARIIPVKPPLIETLLVEGMLLRGSQ